MLVFCQGEDVIPLYAHPLTAQVAERQPLTGWISVEDHAPTEPCDVWVSNWEGVIEGIWSETDEEFLRFDVHGAYESIDNPKHWMPRVAPLPPAASGEAKSHE